MKKIGYTSAKKRNIVQLILFFAIVVLIFIIIWLFCRPCPECGYTPFNVDETKENIGQVSSAETLKTNSIAIPGYSLIELKADAYEQDIALSNPENNNCYFKISLLLEDGTLLWESKLIKPGETSGKIKLKTCLKAGEYEKAVLHYDCFSLDREKKSLNSGETKLTLSVK